MNETTTQMLQLFYSHVGIDIAIILNFKPSCAHLEGRFSRMTLRNI